MTALMTSEARVNPGLVRLGSSKVFGDELRDLLSDKAAHDIKITDDKGRVVFVQRDVVAPKRWSRRAVQVAASKYLYGDITKGDQPGPAGGREPSIYALHGRVARFIADAAKAQGLYDDHDADVFEREILSLTLGQYAAFNSPVWFNVGLDQYGLEGNDTAYAYVAEDGPLGSFGGVSQITDTVKYPQGSACFIQSVGDSMESLMTLARNEAMLFKHGSGTGTDFSTIRSKRETLTGGGSPSGPVSFMKVYDRIASVVKSGGKTRRAAKMQTLSAGHPDILDFITAKRREELKAFALIAGGYPSDFNGEAYDTVAFQNANFSVRVSDAFMYLLEAVPHVMPESDTRLWPLQAVTTGAPIEFIDPRDIWTAIADATWHCGDPGIQFETTINDWHTTPVGMDGRRTPINSSNPCSEYLSIDDSACNLASINLLRFLQPDGHLDLKKLKAAVATMLVAMEVLVEACSYPTRQIAQNAQDYRQLGLGFCNLGGLLQASGIAYDSPEGRLIAGAITSIICGESYRQSAVLAGVQGAFPAFEVNREPMLRVIGKHIQAHFDMAEDVHAYLAKHPVAPPLVLQLAAMAVAGERSWTSALMRGQREGFRHAQVVVIAPTGTIAFMMDADTTGIEPNLSLVTRKLLAGGGTMEVINGLVTQALLSLGYTEEERIEIEAYIAAHGMAEGCRRLQYEHLGVFDTSFAPPGFSRVLSASAHLHMMAAVQPFVTGAISKTVNVPSSFTAAQIAETYLRAWKLGLKCVAIYRDGSKGSQPLEAVCGPKTSPLADPVMPEADRGKRVECHYCGRMNFQPSGTCIVCVECGTSMGGCS